MRSKKLWRLAGGMAVAVGMVLTGTHASAAPASPQGGVVPAKHPIKGSYIVVLKENPRLTASQTAIRLASADLVKHYGGTLHSTYVATIHGYSVRGMSAGQARKLAADPAVRTVYEDGTTHTTGTQSPATWGLDRIDQTNLPGDNSYTYPNDGSGVTAYVLDSGTKPDNPQFEGRASIGKDFVGSDGIDCFGHGTHVTGTVASKTYGVAKKVKIVMLKVLGGDCSGTGPDSAAVDAMDWVTANGVKPAVVNMSLEMDQVGVGDEAAKNSVAAGFVYAVAAGNESSDACGVSPARVPEVITVGATDANDNRAGFSNYGACVDIFAPGSNITSLGLSNGSTSNMSGTSMATPHVAGAAAMYLSANPSATPQQVRDALVDNGSAVVRNPGSGSPNKLLDVSFIDGDTPPPSGCGDKTNADDVSIPDKGAAVSSSIVVTGCDGKASTALPVKVDIDHTYTGDLKVDLIGPSGTAYNLKRSGGIGANGLHTTYTVDASAENANGTWKLRVTDVYTFDTGVVDAWTLSL